MNNQNGNQPSARTQADLRSGGGNYSGPGALGARKAAGPVPYTTSLGKNIEIVGVSPFDVEALRATVPLPSVPIRKVETAVPGFVEEEALTATDLRNDDEKARWAKYIFDLRAAEQKRNTLAADFIMVEGTRFDQSDYEAWVAKRKRWNMPIPDDDNERTIAYFRSAVIGSVDDLNFIVATVMERQGVDEETLARIQDSFRGQVQRNTAEALANSQGQVELRNVLPGNESGESVERRPAQPLLRVQSDGQGSDDPVRFGQ